MGITNRASVHSPSKPLDPTTIEFGKVFTPNFFLMKYADGSWQEPVIGPMQDFQLHPAAIVFHYGQAIFEGLKAFQQDSGRIVIFRPEMNARRFNLSARRLDMPEVDEGLFVEACAKLVENERYFVPASPGSLYIRPSMIGVEPCIGVRSSKEFYFFIMTLPAGTYFKEVTGGAGSVNVLVSESVFRACRGGTGNVKAAGNYAASLNIITEAKKKGCVQVLFLNAADRAHIEEMGGMNVFFVREGKLLTPPLSDTILAGVVRDTVLQLARDMGIEAIETPLAIREVLADIRSGRITEAMACGTAASITGIGSLQTESGEVIRVGSESPGPMTNGLYHQIRGIQYGQIPDRHGWITEVCTLEPVAR
ncbi:MAG: branched-chain amino acid aminotransferase [Acidimicrobiia bacterium]|nr:branched-chain amino acid aminotransferase [Acidimicrobiia bacterium]